MALIERIADVAVDAFVRGRISANLPVIVTDAMTSWPARTKWTPEYFREHFGDWTAQVYDDLFTLQDLMPLRRFLDDNFNCSRTKPSGLYVRWYTKLKDLEFDWADRVFDFLSTDWSHPYFLPKSRYVMPICVPPAELCVSRDLFPYKGLLISPKGGRTRLHRDPYGTDALLCQFYGRKRIVFYHPSVGCHVMRGSEFVDPLGCDQELGRTSSTVRPMFDDELQPGEILFIPSGWFHDVTSLDDSISITWNFVHAANLKSFLEALTSSADERDHDMLQFFFSRESRSKQTQQEVIHIAKVIGQCADGKFGAAAVSTQDVTMARVRPTEADGIVHN